MGFIIDLLRILCAGLDFDIYDIIKDEGYDSKDKAVERIKMRVWFLAILIPFVMTGIAIFMKTAFVWKVLLFVPSVIILVLVLKAWWKYYFE
ncbi:MAG: hypothetical protein IJM96_02515 [Clostridia bacterium]|nr:hypothetical protein [Clostridia bacterium]